MRAYCSEVVLVPAPTLAGPSKRWTQLRSMVSRHSYERRSFGTENYRHALHELLRKTRFDVVVLEAPFLAHHPFRSAPPGAPAPKIVLDEHNIEHDLARQSAQAGESPMRRLYHSVNWRKVKAEEIEAWRRADGVCFTSSDDDARARALVPEIRSTVVPNAVDVDYFRPEPSLPASDGQTLLFFGTMNYFPNQDGVRYLLQEIWPILEKSHARARVKIVGSHPMPEVLAMRGPRVEVTGLVDDVRPHLAGAAAIVVPLRVGGGTRFKILEAMSMGKPVVSTTIGAEGISAVPGEQILLADQPEAFARAAARLLDDAALAERLGGAGRTLIEGRYSWAAAGAQMERFVEELIAAPGSAAPQDRSS